MTIRLSATDILNRMVENNYVYFGPLNCRQSEDSRRPAIILRASYHFNSASSKYRGTGAGQDVMQRLKNPCSECAGTYPVGQIASVLP